jgi:pimeloyl-ACP methyl ester carboxylesterase
LTQRDGAGLAFHDSGRGGAVVLFVHGWQGDRTVWNDVIAALGPDVRTIAVDLRGSGDSSNAPGPYRLDRFSADLQELIELLDVAPVVVVGHSMGAKVALRLAIDAPHMVRGLALIAPVPATAAGFSEKGNAYLRATAGDPVAVKTWLARTLSSAAEPAMLELLCAAAARTPRDAALESFESWAHTDIAEETKAITVPTVVIAPENDEPERARAKVTELITGARHVVLPAASHYAIVERPSEIAELIRGFLRAYDFAK